MLAFGIGSEGDGGNCGEGNWRGLVLLILLFLLDLDLGCRDNEVALLPVLAFKELHVAFHGHFCSSVSFSEE